MGLRFLDFDCSDDGDGLFTFDAMASVAASDWPALQAEVTRVLDWAHRGFAGVRGALDEDGDWDYDLQGGQETLAPLLLDFEASAGHLACRVQPPMPPRYTLSLTLSGTSAFAAALSECFALGQPGGQ